MSELLDSPGMVAALGLIAVVQGVSLLVMALVITVFLRQRAKYRAFLRALGDEAALGKPGLILVPAYAAVTVVLAFVTAYLFVFRPHLL